MDAQGKLKLGRKAFRHRRWAAAYQSLSAADDVTLLGVADLERLATSAYLIGREDAFVTLLERAHHEHLNAGESERAARSAFWLGLSLLLRGETGRATGWLARAQRLIEDRDCVEQGYMLLPVAEQELAKADSEAAYASATEAASIGQAFGDADLIACARHLQGRALIQRGEIEPGLALLDEAMVAVTAGELSPIVTGLVYCSVIECCQQSHAVGRAREWTSALADWCDEQPEMVAFTATCLVHRAQILRLSGEWRDALEEAGRACQRKKPPAAAFYERGEVHRLKGEFAAAEEAYQKASQGGREPLPGLVLLRLAQGRTDVAQGMIRRALSSTTDRLERVKLLPAYIEVMLAMDEVDEARGACRELEEIAESIETGVLAAIAAHARGAVELAAGDAGAALGSLRRARQAWQEVEAPYKAARVRELIGRACHALGDSEGSRLELQAAKAVFEQLGAEPDLGRLDSIAHPTPSRPSSGLTPRELQVLRLVATGKTNKAIATELFLSEKTVDRHVSNILTKLNVPSRTAATAYAYEHELI